jgi:hypothetical protein
MTSAEASIEVEHDACSGSLEKGKCAHQIQHPMRFKHNQWVYEGICILCTIHYNL